VVAGTYGFQLKVGETVWTCEEEIEVPEDGIATPRWTIGTRAVRGTVRVEASPADAAPRIDVRLIGKDGRRGAVRAGEGGAFEVTGVVPGEYHLVVEIDRPRPKPTSTAGSKARPSGSTSSVPSS